MAYYAFFIEAFKVAWTEKKLMPSKKKTNLINKKKYPSKMFYKKLKQMSSACSNFTVSVEFLIVNMFQMTFLGKKKYLYNIVECEGNFIQE